MAFRPIEQTFTDTVRWLVEAGHLHQKYAGQMLQGELQHG